MVAFLNRVCRFGARAELLETLEGRPRAVTSSSSTFPLVHAAAPPGSVDSLGSELEASEATLGESGSGPLTPDALGPALSVPHRDNEARRKEHRLRVHPPYPRPISSDDAHPEHLYTAALAQGTHVCPSGLQWRRGRIRMLDREKEDRDKFTRYFCSLDHIHCLGGFCVWMES